MAKHSCLDFFAVIPALILALAIQSFALPRQMEALDRGLLVSNVGKSGMLVSWRLLGTEKSDTEFNLYRDGVKIATIGKTDGTNYLDRMGRLRPSTRSRLSWTAWKATRRMRRLS
jgi:hypothetical protein